ncbi:hypothetical protein [Pseudidiomarina sp.]|uniref:hypothetical protein n=1 Tax=Pseudidiomarina sp. TaxID=2081707 RepID=UPI003A978DF2
MAVMSEKIGKELVSILGLPPSSVTGITLRCESGRPAEVAVTLLLSANQAHEICEVVRRYELVDAQE